MLPPKKVEETSEAKVIRSGHSSSNPHTLHVTAGRPCSTVETHSYALSAQQSRFRGTYISRNNSILCVGRFDLKDFVKGVDKGFVSCRVQGLLRMLLSETTLLFIQMHSSSALPQ